MSVGKLEKHYYINTDSNLKYYLTYKMDERLKQYYKPEIANIVSILSEEDCNVSGNLQKGIQSNEVAEDIDTIHMVNRVERPRILFLQI
jgi:hypothetical protein